jgi:hypothetical protein
MHSQVSETLAYLLAARQSRLCALACPDMAASYKARARFWLVLAHAARETEGRRLP